MYSHPFFLLGLTCIVLHEMDAVRCHEWRIFPGLALLKEDLAMKLFMFAHVPLFFFLFGALTRGTDTTAVIRGLNLFFMVHLGLHILFLRHPKNEFKDWISWSFIAGAAIFGGISSVFE